jgi:hypothetical protein
LLFSSLLALSGVFAAPSIAASDGLDLLAHRAVYELTLIDSERDSGIDFASGLFIFEVTGASCSAGRWPAT